MKLLLLGHSRHGKDTVAELLGLSFCSSSEFAADHVIFPILGPKYGYESPLACFQDRHQHRKEWFDIISDYNREDPCRLAKALLAVCDVYVGMRSSVEFQGCRHLFDLVVWVDALDRHPPEDAESCSVTPFHAHYILDNNGSLEDLAQQVSRLKNKIFLI